MYEKEQMKHRCTTHSGIVHPTKGDEYEAPDTIDNTRKPFHHSGKTYNNKFIHCTALSGWHSIRTESLPSVMVGWVYPLWCVMPTIYM